VTTFRRMTDSEVRQARPLRLHVVTVQHGDTLERFAGRMPLVDRPLERFLILNGLNPGDQLRPGEKVKIVTE
jgi:predicted Zn-dependent protease